LWRYMGWAWGATWNGRVAQPAYWYLTNEKACQPSIHVAQLTPISCSATKFCGMRVWRNCDCTQPVKIGQVFLLSLFLLYSMHVALLLFRVTRSTHKQIPGCQEKCCTNFCKSCKRPQKKRKTCEEANMNLYATIDIKLIANLCQIDSKLMSNQYEINIKLISYWLRIDFIKSTLNRL
jgi:hypothetical protein